ncbi:MAG TPA: adenosylcobalamin-dependent ribonucleoside-diphosphate reductase [Solirubrobacteraceae bacterium]|nr:adenosylcobalamin-dependent ribonucleoside-diphosphate reductase [Solirubrobacteraceae bacterium]
MNPPMNPTTSHDAAPGQALEITRFFTDGTTHPFDAVEWEVRDARIGHGERVAFEQQGVEFPTSWSQNATNIVSQKYFRGQLGSPEREHSVRQMIGRVAGTITRWGREGGYFAAAGDAEAFEHELTHILLHQMAAFNSPVWFNVGFEEQPQCSACLPGHALVSTPAGMIPIGELVDGEMVGTEVYDSSGSTRVLAVKHNGRKPVWRVALRNGSFVEATADHVVKASAERRGRAAWLRVDQLKPGMRMHLHPHKAKVADPVRVTVGGPGGESALELIDETDRTAVSEAALAGWLQADGYVGERQSGRGPALTLEFEVAGAEEFAWVSDHLDVAFPHIPRKVREASLESTQVRRISLQGDVLRAYAERWGLFTSGPEARVPERLYTASHEEIAAFLRSAFQAGGYVSLRHSGGYDSARVGVATISDRWSEDVQLLLYTLGIYSRRTRRREKRDGRNELSEVWLAIGSERARFAELVGFVSHEKQRKLLSSLCLRHPKHCADLREEEIVSIERTATMDVYDIQTESGEFLTNNVAVHNCFILSVQDTMESILDWNTKEGMIFRGGSGSGINLSNIRGSQEPLAKGGTASGPVSFMRGADSWAGTIKSGGKTRRAAKMVVLDVDHPDIREFIWCKAKEEDKAEALRDAGFDMSIDGEGFKSIQYQNANNSVRLTDDFMRAVENDEDWHLLARTTGQPIGEPVPARQLMQEIAEAAWRCADPGVQFDTTINTWHTAPNSGRINASNPCSEYMHVDDSACNLASLNLMKFRRSDGTLDVEAFEHAVDVMLLAQEIIVGPSSYPTEGIARNARAFRQLGLGYANLGAYLMADGVPYDSDAGRGTAAAITALMTGRAYRRSAEIAAAIGPYDRYSENREPHNRVMRMHRDASYAIAGDTCEDSELLGAARRSWDEAVELGERHGYRNAQATVLAPTGCLVAGSLVSTSRGLVRIGMLGKEDGPEWQDLDVQVATDEGPRPASKFYVNGMEHVVSVESKRGYRIQGTPLHRIKVLSEDGEQVWRRLADVKPGDRVPVMLNGLVGEPQEVPLPPLGDLHWNADHQTHVPRVMTAELAEFVGYFMGDGSLHAKGIRLCVTDGDNDVLERLLGLGQELFGLKGHVLQHQGYNEIAFHSVPLTIWWDACGFSKRPPFDGHSGKGWSPRVPNAILHSNDRDVYAAFVRGLFEADGNANHGYAYWSTTNETFSRDVQTLLLTLGFVTTRDISDGPERLGAPCHRVRLLNASSAHRFVKSIGFISSRKNEALVAEDHPQAARHDHIPVSRAQVDVLAPENDRLRRNLLLQLSRDGVVSRRSAVALLERSSDCDESETAAELGHMLGFFYDTVESVELLDEQPTFDLSVPDNLTYVANGFISHNTISFLMDCDTTGVEPDFSLVKFKELVGGGQMTIVNRTVPLALANLGYSEPQIEQIEAYLAEHGTVVGAPGLAEEHLEVFDVAVGERAISHMGHIKMMGAVQPFISGAISKTVNLPEQASVDDIAEAFIESWKLGIKALAIYRDGSKTAQALRTDAQKETGQPADVDEIVEQAVAKALAEVGPQRKRMPRERQSITHKFSIAGHEGYITAGMYEDGSVGEIFLTDIGKEGSTLRGMMNSFATAISIALQYGVPLETLVRKFSYMRFEPEGITGNPEIPFAKSMPDYIMRWLASRFLDVDAQEELGILTPAVRARKAAQDAAQAVAATDTAGPAADADAETEARVEGDARSDEQPKGSGGNGGKGGNGGNGGAAPAAASFTETPPVVPATLQGLDLGPACSQCGGMMQRTGSCYTCSSCGNNTGCG